ncbi:ATP-binding cassette domain-containing protein [Streptomyces sp. NPDC005302]|uniref:branched-chain amino acid ABC transporter permease/ATP-binding protein n=1 Tax=Streptomyces sp. NPDC005302 TaxID=3154675 RepID=UPI0033B86891
MASLTYDLTLAGLSVGGAAALTGIGLIVTHRATGVLNLAHGAIAMVCAYLLRQFTVEWGWPLALGTSVTLLVVAPAIGVTLERLVFRPLSAVGGDPARTLVASIGVFVLLVGAAALVWGPGARADVPAPVPADPWGQLAVAGVLAVVVGAVTRRTRFGLELRAVVDDPALAVLGGVDADRVAAAGWAFGSFTAGLTGVLLAPYVRLDPYGMPLLVMEVMAVAVAARMRSLPVAVVVALGIGVAQGQLTRLHPSGPAGPLLQAVGANLFVVALLVAALVLPGIGGRDALPRPAAPRVRTPPGAGAVALVLFLLPLGFAGSDLHTSVQVPALGVVLLSLVVVTGRGGQVSLGQAAYAGLGALFTALLAAGRVPGVPRLPELAALAVAVLLVAPLGLLTGWPAIRRHGLALALATFAVGVGVSRFVFAQPYAVSGLSLDRPAGFDGDRAYYVLELVLLAVAVLAVSGLRRGRTGRALAALRDHEAGASAAGVRVPALKLAAFVTGAALAALGGGMLGMGVRAFDATAYDPVRGLLWFAAVVVLGADSVLGALAAAALLVGLDAGARGGLAAALIGVLAVLVGRFPGGPHEALHAARTRLRRPATLTPLGSRVRRRLRPAVETPRSGVPTAEVRAFARRPEAPARKARPFRSTSPEAGPPGKPTTRTRASGAPPAEPRPSGAPPGVARPSRAPAASDGIRSEPTTAEARPSGAPTAEATPPGSVPAESRPSRAPTAAEGMRSEPTTAETRPSGAPPAVARPSRAPTRAEGMRSEQATEEARPSEAPPGVARPSRAPTTADGMRSEPTTAETRPSRSPTAEAAPPGSVSAESRPSRAPTAAKGMRSEPTTAEARPSEAHPGVARPSRAPTTADGMRSEPTTAQARPSRSPTAEAAPPGSVPAESRPSRAPTAAAAAGSPGVGDGGREPSGAAHSPSSPRPSRRPVPRPAAPSPPALPLLPRTSPPPRPAPPRALSARRLRVAYGGFTALDEVSLDVRPGRITAVVGPNGAGKSTLFHCLAGTLRPSGGQVLLGEHDITRLAAHARTRLGIARTFQDLAVFPSLTVAENVRVGADQGRIPDPAAVARTSLLLGLDGPVRSLPAAGLPTGTLRRVELARALAGSPRVLLLDEPAAGLDGGEVAALAKVLRALAADGMALLVVEHDLDLVAGLAHTVHVMAAGRVVTSGPADRVLETGPGG